MENLGQIIRSKKTGKSRYTPVSNEILQSLTLSAEEKSILVHLLSLPEDWVVYKMAFGKALNMGRHRFNNAWKGLQQKGYIVSVQMIDRNTNLMRGWNHMVHEDPVLNEERIDQPSELPKFGQSEDRVLYKVITEQSNNKDKREEVLVDTKKETPTQPPRVELIDPKPEYAEMFNLWFDYKKEKKQTYQPIGRDTLIKSMESKYNAEQFKKCVLYSIGQNYAGIHEPKDLLKVEVQTPQPTQKRFNIADYE
jgi:hypothetical protein